MLKHRLLILSVFLLVFTGCSSYKEIQCTAVKGFKVNKISTEGIEAQVMLSIKNPNRMGFTLYPSEFEIKYSGIYLGKAKLAEKVHIHKQAEETYSFAINNDFKDVKLMDVLKLLGSINFSNTVEVKGELKVGKFFIKKTVPVNLSEKIGQN